MNDINETAKIVKLRINELPDSGWEKYLANQFLYKKKSGKKKKKGVKFLIYNEYGSKIVDEFVLIWEKQLKNEDLSKYLFDKKGNKIKRGMKTFLLYEKNGEINYDKIVLFWKSRLEYESSFMYNRNGEKRWGRTKFGIVGEDGRFERFLTLLLDPEDDYPLWMKVPEITQQEFDVQKSVFKNIKENKEDQEEPEEKNEKEDQEEPEEKTSSVFIQSLFFLSMLTASIGFAMTVSTMHKKIKLVNNTADNVKKISAQTIRIHGHANKEISDEIVRIHGFANSKHEPGTVKEKREEVTGDRKKILKNETSKNLNEKTTYEISSPTSI